MIPFLFVFSALTLTVQPHTYFEGSVTIYRHKPQVDGTKTGERILSVDLSRNRIRLNGIGRNETTGLFAQIGARDLLIRNDKQDFVFLTDQKTAIVMSKEEIQAIANLVAASRGGERTTSQLLTIPNLEWTETQRKRDILGFNTTQWNARATDQPLVMRLWIADRFRIAWGMLAEPWVAQAGIAGILPIQDIFSDGRTPLRVETIRDGALFEIIEFTTIERKSTAALRLDIPADHRILTFQEMLMERARNAY